jgi:hypothetical protein
LTGSEVYEADARIVAQTLPDGLVTCSILDGPYNLGKAEWDRVPRGGTLGDLYTGHLDDVGRLSAASASLYLWNTSGGWADLHPLVLARGWAFRGLIVWHKTGANPALLSAKTSGKWPDLTEVCGHYQRGNAYHTNAEGIGNVWQFSSTGDLGSERLVSGSTSRRTFGGSGTPVCADPLHPCQKPLLFAERMIRASTRPGDTVWVPFGGTLREMVAAERMARGKPGEARRVISCELNLDGVDYIGPAIAQAQGLPTQGTAQPDLFGGAS